jgi:uncharacterized protein (TIGR02996 family)
VSAEAQLLAAVYASPFDLRARSVYADALLERGAPLGEFIQLQLARGAGKKASIKREKELFAEHRASLWSDHPVVIPDPAGRCLQYEGTALGFPVTFNIPLGAAETDVTLLSRHPGWSTVRSVRGPMPVHRFLPDELPSLIELREIKAEDFMALAAKQWPVRSMIVEGEDFLAPVTGLPKLEHLTHWSRMPVENALEMFRATKLFERLQSLSLSSNGWQLPDVLQLLAQLPKSLKKFEITHSIFNAADFCRLEFTRGPKEPALSLEVDRHVLELALSWLKQVPATAFSSVTFNLSSRGGFTKRTRPEAEAQVKEVLPRFANGALISKHPR